MKSGKLLAGLVLLRCGFASAQADPPLVRALPDDQIVSVQADLVYRTAGDTALRFDLYRPKQIAARLPVLIIYNGFAMAGLKQRAQMVGWARLAAAGGFAAITYDSHPRTAGDDWTDLIAHLRTEAAQYQIDPDNVALLAWSGHVSRGVGLAMDPARRELRSALFLYGVGPAPSLRLDLPVLFVRSGLDTPGLNRGLDSLVLRALAANAPITVVGYGAGAHGFELVNDNDYTRELVDQVIAFARTHARANITSAVRADLKVAEAAAALYRGDFASAVPAYQALAAHNPSSVDYNLKLGESLLGMNDNARALAALQRAWTLNNGARARDIGYPAAIAAARLRDFNSAEPFLRALLNRGASRQQLLDDAQLAGLRADPRFIALLSPSARDP